MNFYFLFSPVFGGFLDLQRIPFAIAAVFFSLILGLIAGPVAGNANPLFWLLIDKILGAFGDRLNKAHRPAGDLMLRGFVLSLLGCGLAAGFIYSVWRLRISMPHALLTEAFLLSLLISSAALWRAILTLQQALSADKKLRPGGGYLAIARSLRANLVVADDYGITRGAMGLVARIFDKGLVVPLFWYIVGGLPFATMYGLFAALTWRFNRVGLGGGFGVFPAFIERVMGAIPSLISAALLILAALFTPGARPLKGLQALSGLKNRASYAQGGFALSALAWALQVSLGGPYQDLAGHSVKSGWVGPPGVTAKTAPGNLSRALFLSVMAHIVVILALGGIYLMA